MKKTLLLLISIVLVPILAQAQWTPLGVFPAGDTLSGSNHGIAVDGEGKIWITDFYATGALRSDSTVTVVDVSVFNPDGS